MKRYKNEIIIVICIIGAFIFWRQALNYETRIDALENKVSLQQSENESLETLLYNSKQFEMANWSQVLHGINNQLEIYSSDNKRMHLIDLLNGKKLLFHFQSEMCSSCVDRELQNLEVLAETFGKDKILILAEDYRATYIQRAEQFKKWQGQIYVVDDNPFVNGGLLITPTLSVLEDNKLEIFYHAPKNRNDSFEMLLGVLKQTIPMVKPIL
jgi:hypothetical protein